MLPMTLLPIVVCAAEWPKGAKVLVACNTVIYLSLAHRIATPTLLALWVAAAVLIILLPNR
jgi:hypothetical protein